MDGASKTVKCFEDLHIFREARLLCNEVWKLTQSGPFSRDLTLTSQIRRASISIVSNIAEGFERESDLDFARFLTIAKGSCGEARAQMLVALDQQYINKDDFSEFTTRARKLSAGLANLSSYLRKSSQTKKLRRGATHIQSPRP